MQHSHNSKWKLAASLALAAALALAGSASATLTVTTDNELGSANTYPFTPTWVVATNNSLIANAVPTTALGNFSLELAGRDVNSLTYNTNLTIDIIQPSTSTSANYVTCGNGSGAGSLIVYTLPASANGYNLTNITVYGGWANRGRDQQAYTVLYSTVANPAHFVYLSTVNYNPAIAADTASANREIINDSLGGVIAANVAAVQFVFTTPQVENGFCGYAAITVGGTPAASVVAPIISITTSNQSDPAAFTPTWTPETPNLIAGLAPTTAAGNFTQEGSGGTSVLTDGVIGESGTLSGFATCGASGGTSLIYTLTNVVNGTDVTNVTLYSGWGDAGRDGQYFILSYATIAAPTTYIPITTVFYNPQGVSGASANRVAISTSTGVPLAGGVANLKFDFSSPPNANQFDNAYSGFSEIIVQGSDTATPPPPPSPVLTQDTLPTRAETVVGDQVVFSADYSNAPPANLQWQLVNTAGTVTNDIPGATTPMLTLNNVQLTDSGSYRLKAVNATNGAAAPSYSTAASLAVGTPTTVGNVIVQYAGQVGPESFYPAWTINTNIDLIFGFPTDGSGNPGTATAGAGNFANEAGLNGDPTILADGFLSDLTANMVSAGWVNVGAGQSMTYYLPLTANGFDITNITVYGGWPDVGRNQQKYQVLYSTVSAPAAFTSIGTFDYNPSFTASERNATRVTLIPVTGPLAQNVHAVQINFNMQSKNNWNGYSEITINGTPSLGVIPSLTQDITPLTAEDVVGSTLTISAGFSGATGYQWQKNGVNIPGATTPTLTLNNLQLTDTATNGGYALLGYNGAGTNSTRACAVIVNPVPAAVGNVVTAFAYQTSDASAPNTFSPTWDTSALSSSLIASQNPPGGGFGTGDFTGGGDVAGGLPVLTDGGYGIFAYDTTHPAFACGGPSAGQHVIYTLGANANGYDVTNIAIAGGWNDNGRNAQVYTVSYSTALNPSTFIPIKAVNHRPTFPNQSVIRTTIKPAAGVLAGNVYAIKVDFTSPGGVPNGYSGYSEVSVFGSPSAAPPTGPVVTVENQNTDAPTWILESGNLIAGQLPSSVGPGNFQLESAGGTVVLTDGSISPLTGTLPFATCGNIANGAGQSVTYTSAYGWNLTNIVVYSGWGNYNRDGQFYDVSYSTLANPSTFLPLVSVDYNPLDLGAPSANRVAITNSTGGPLATGVAAVKFDFTRQGGNDNGYSGYAEIVLQGTVMAYFNPPVVSGGNLILTGAGIPGESYALLTSTNVTAPIATWTTNLTGIVNGSGILSNAIPISASELTRFFRLKTP